MTNEIQFIPVARGGGQGAGGHQGWDHLGYAERYGTAVCRGLPSVIGTGDQIPHLRYQDPQWVYPERLRSGRQPDETGRADFRRVWTPSSLSANSKSFPTKAGFQRNKPTQKPKANTRFSTRHNPSCPISTRKSNDWKENRWSYCSQYSLRVLWCHSTPRLSRISRSKVFL